MGGGEGGVSPHARVCNARTHCTRMQGEGGKSGGEGDLRTACVGASLMKAAS